MDITSVLLPLLDYLKFFIPLALLIAVLKSPWFKGKLGEFAVNLILKKHLNNEQYHLLKNITIPTTDGTTQIDHVVVSQFGIFVIETKNYRGWIFGSEKQRVWTQKIFKRSYKFQNPLHQNYKHIKTLETLLKIPECNFHSVIIFSKEATFKTDMPKNVGYAFPAMDYIKSKRGTVFSIEEVHDLVLVIEKESFKKGVITDIKHVKNINKELQNPAETKSCPKCDNQLVIRTVKKGVRAGEQFMGCTEYPKCRYTKNIV